jgi:sec-independent protein translocase protein TatA
MGLDNPLHIAFLLVIMLMVFGAKRLPEMGKSLGHGLRGFKDAINPDSPAQPMLTNAEIPAAATGAEIVAPLAVETPEPVPVVIEHDAPERAAA